jgi:hypothetical protein
MEPAQTHRVELADILDWNFSRSKPILGSGNAEKSALIGLFKEQVDMLTGMDKFDYNTKIKAKIDHFRVD